MEDLIKNDASFELYHNSEGASLLNNRVLTTYPSEKSSFQVFLGLDGYSNFEDDKKDEKKETEKDPKDTLSKVDPEKVAQGITATAGAFGSVASTVQAFKGDTPKKPSRRKQLKEVCGRKPLSKKKLEAYNTCVADYNAGKRGGVVDNQTDSTPPTPPTEPAPNNTKKIIIGLVVVGVLVGAYIGYKKGLFSGKATN